MLHETHIRHLKMRDQKRASKGKTACIQTKDGERKGNNIDWHKQITKFMKILNKVRKGKKACLTDLIFF